MVRVGETVTINRDWFGGGHLRGLRAVVTRVSFLGTNVWVTVPTAFGDSIEAKVPGHHIQPITNPKGAKYA